MFYKLANKIEEYGVPAMIAVLIAFITLFGLLFILTKGWVIVVLPVIGLWVIIQAWIDVKKDERKYMNLNSQREDENEHQ
jgi:predicted membrane protein